MKLFLEEIKEELKKEGCTLKNIKWVGFRFETQNRGKLERMHWQNFIEQAHFSYNNKEYGKININPNLEICAVNKTSCILWARVLVPIWKEKWEITTRRVKPTTKKTNVYKKMHLTEYYSKLTNLSIRTNVINPADQ